MAKSVIWAEFVKILKFRAVASQAVQILDGAQCLFKKEVDVVNKIYRITDIQ